MEPETKAESHKWEGKTTAKLSGPKPDQIWPFLEDFCNFHKWHPILTACYLVEGDLGQPGSVRFCSAESNNESGNSVSWVKEKLLTIDPVARSLSYEITENNMGFGFYVATMKVLGVEEGCEIEWSFVADPVDGWKLEDLVSYLKSCLQAMAGKMEQAVLNA